MEDKEETSSSSSKKKESLPRVDNPYARKEVSYVCETGGEVSGVVGGIFRRVREARELGESHGRGVEARLGKFLHMHGGCFLYVVVWCMVDSCLTCTVHIMCVSTCTWCCVSCLPITDIYLLLYTLSPTHISSYGLFISLGDSSQPTTMRQTNVVVMPNCDDLSKFHAFDKLVQAINQARRASRDFVLKKKEDGTDGKKDWM